MWRSLNLAVTSLHKNFHRLFIRQLTIDMTLISKSVFILFISYNY